MAKGVRIRLGDVFEVPLADGSFGYVQYIADDTSMLDSYVIRAFRGCHPPSALPSLEELASHEVQFFAHVFLKLCVKFGHWKKIGTGPLPDKIDVMFRASWDDGNPDIKVSRRWYVWRANEPLRDVGELKAEYQNAEIGCVLPFDAIAERILTGAYVMVYPGY